MINNKILVIKKEQTYVCSFQKLFYKSVITNYLTSKSISGEIPVSNS